MALPLFGATDDPGPSFMELLRRIGPPLPEMPRSAPGSPAPGVPAGVPHGTTVLAVRYTDGVVMAGDRRATAGNEIAHRSVEKVQPADTYSGVAFAGAASPA